jgi:cytoskeletal protein RodZ
VYRRRRLAVVLVLLLIVAGAVLAVWQPWRGAATTGAAPSPSAPSSSAPSSSPPASAAPDPSTPPPTSPPTEPDPETAEGTPTPDPSATLSVCSSGEVTVTAETDKTAYASGEKPKLSITLVNDGDEPCVMNVGTATQTFVVESGSDTWWRSTDCQTKSSDQVVQLKPGSSVSTVEPLVWDRTRSSVDTCGGDRPRALPGYYNLIVSIGGIESDGRQFRLR